MLLSPQRYEFGTELLLLARKENIRAEEYSWDFFLAHAGPDLAIAEDLYGLLAPYCKVFLDKSNLLLGDQWDRKLGSAQGSSLVTVVLISKHTNEAYYQREEISAALDMARHEESGHRVVPVYLEDIKPPYGLQNIHGSYVYASGGLKAVAEELLDLLHKLRSDD